MPKKSKCLPPKFMQMDSSAHMDMLVRSVNFSQTMLELMKTHQHETILIKKPSAYMRRKHGQYASMVCTYKQLKKEYEDYRSLQG